MFGGSFCLPYLLADNSMLKRHLLVLTMTSAPKSQQLAKNPNFELAWWFAPSGDQFRIKGRAYVLGRPDHEITKTFLSENAKRLSPPSFLKDKGEEFNWEDERRRIFEKISPPIRASFVRPIPGTPLKQSDRNDKHQGGSGKGEGDYDPKSWPEELKMDGDKDLIEKSYANFALTYAQSMFVYLIPQAMLTCELPFLQRPRTFGSGLVPVEYSAKPGERTCKATLALQSMLTIVKTSVCDLP